MAHLTLRDAAWLERELAQLSAAGVRMAMIGPGLVNGKPLSHPDHDRIWSAFVDSGVTPTFHVADQPRVFDDAWYTDSDYAFVPSIETVFLWTPPALALTDLIVNGILDRHRELRIGVVELSANWVPPFLQILDGALDFLAKLHGRSSFDRVSTSAVTCGSPRSPWRTRKGSAPRPATSSCAAATTHTPKARPLRSTTTAPSCPRPTPSPHSSTTTSRSCSTAEGGGANTPICATVRTLLTPTPMWFTRPVLRAGQTP